MSFYVVLKCMLYENDVAWEGLQQVLSCNLSVKTEGEPERPQK